MIRTLLKSVREYRAPSLLCPILMVWEAAMDIVIPFLMTFVIGELELLAGDPAYTVNGGRLAVLMAALLVCAMLALVFGVAGGKLAAKASCGFAHNLREDLYGKIQSFSFANIDRFSTASLITRITTDVTNVQNAYQMCLRMIVRAPMLLLVSILMTAWIDGSISLIFVGVAVVLGIVVAIAMVKVAAPFRTMFRKYDDLNLVVQENLTAIRVVKSFVREAREIDKMHQATGEVYRYSVKAEKILTFLTPCATFAMFVSNILILLVGSNMAVGNLPGNVTAADLQTLVIYSMQILTGVLSVAMCINFISISKGSMERICEVLTEKPTITAPADPITSVRDGSVDFCHASFAYSARSSDPLLRQPKVLIFDDSTSAVDTRTDAQIRQALRKYAPDTTKIIIAQRVASVQDADRIILLDKGRGTDVGSHEELLRTSEIYRNLYESQMSGKEEG